MSVGFENNCKDFEFSPIFCLLVWNFNVGKLFTLSPSFSRASDTVRNQRSYLPQVFEDMLKTNRQRLFDVKNQPRILEKSELVRCEKLSYILESFFFCCRVHLYFN